MGKTIRYEPNRAGLKELLASPIAQTLVNEQANRIESAAGDGFVASQRQGKNRYRAIVYADTWSARRRNARDNTLLRALG